MFRTLTAKALLGASALAVVGGATAYAASPSPGASAHAKAKADYAYGRIVKLSDAEMTIAHGDRKDKSATTDETFELNKETAVYRAPDKTRLGVDALKVGKNVRVRYAEVNGQNVAKRVVIALDYHYGKVVSKGDNSFVMKTAKGENLTVSVNDQTKWTTGTRRDRQPGSFAGLQVGDRVAVWGRPDANGTFDAVRVLYPSKA